MRNLPINNSKLDWDLYSASHQKRMIYRELKILEQKGYEDAEKVNNQYKFYSPDTMYLVFFMIFTRKALSSVVTLEFDNHEEIFDNSVYRIAKTMYNKYDEAGLIDHAL